MALEIKVIPTLHGKEAERFIKMADDAYQKRHNMPQKGNYSKHTQVMRSILKKANLG